jgi:hypothetical protein
MLLKALYLNAPIKPVTPLLFSFILLLTDCNLETKNWTILRLNKMIQTVGTRVCEEVEVSIETDCTNIFSPLGWIPINCSKTE